MTDLPLEMNPHANVCKTTPSKPFLPSISLFSPSRFSLTDRNFQASSTFHVSFFLRSNSALSSPIKPYVSKLSENFWAPSTSLGGKHYTSLRLTCASGGALTAGLSSPAHRPSELWCSILHAGPGSSSYITKLSSDSTARICSLPA